MKIKSVKKILLNKKKNFYDITVDSYHNFIIGDSKILTHNSSLNGAITGMAQDFKNSMPLFKGEGQFGSLRSPEAGAPRYIGVKLNDNFKLFYKDFDLLTPRYEEGEEIEPYYFLPIIPAVLLNGSSGIAVGFATNILNRHPLDLIDACMDVLLEKKKIREIKPWIKGFKGSFEKFPQGGENSWLIRGVYNVKNTTTVEISEIVPGYTFEDYDTHLTMLEEKGIILSYEDNRQGSNLSYTLKFTRSKLAELLEKNRLDDTLKIIERDTENLTTLDEFGKLKIFKDSEEIVRYFVDFRLKYYQKRKDYIISEIIREIPILTNKAKFIKFIVENKIKVSKVKREDIIKNLEDLKFDKLDDSYNYLLNMSIYSLTLERYEELMKQVDIKNAELISAKELNIIDLYKKDLNDLRKKLEKDFKV